MIEGRRVLLIDDNERDVELTVRAFRRNHIANEIVVRSDGLVALDYLFDLADRDATQLPAVVLLDIKLPRVDGLEVLRRIRADDRTKRVPVVLLTSSSEEKDKTTGYELGANSYVRKQVDFTRFLESAQSLGQYWLAVNEPPGS